MNTSDPKTCRLVVPPDFSKRWLLSPLPAAARQLIMDKRDYERASADSECSSYSLGVAAGLERLKTAGYLDVSCRYNSLLSEDQLEAISEASIWRVYSLSKAARARLMRSLLKEWIRYLAFRRRFDEGENAYQREISAILDRCHAWLKEIGEGVLPAHLNRLLPVAFARLLVALAVNHKLGADGICETRQYTELLRLLCPSLARGPCVSSPAGQIYIGSDADMDTFLERLRSAEGQHSIRTIKSILADIGRARRDLPARMAGEFRRAFQRLFPVEDRAARCDLAFAHAQLLPRFRRGLDIAGFTLDYMANERLEAVARKLPDARARGVLRPRLDMPWADEIWDLWYVRTRTIEEFRGNEDDFVRDLRRRFEAAPRGFIFWRPERKIMRRGGRPCYTESRAVLEEPLEWTLRDLVEFLREEGHYAAGPYTELEQGWPTIYVAHVGPGTLRLYEDGDRARLTLTAVRSLRGVGEEGMEKLLRRYADLAVLRQVDASREDPSMGPRYTCSEAVCEGPLESTLHDLVEFLRDEGHYAAGPYTELEQGWPTIYVAHVGPATLRLYQDGARARLTLTAVRSLPGVGEEGMEKLVRRYPGARLERLLKGLCADDE